MKKWIVVTVLLISIIIAVSGMSMQIGEGMGKVGSESDHSENVSMEDSLEIDDPCKSKELQAEQLYSNQNNTLKILAVGDLMFHMPQVNSARTINGTYDFTPPFIYIKDYVLNADLAIANLETVIAGDEMGFSGYPRFNSPVAVLDAIVETGFDILVTSNNHGLDKGKVGIEKTIMNITARGLEYVGTSLDKRRPYVIREENGIRIGLMSYTYGLNGLDSLLTDDERDRMINLIDQDKIAADIQKLKTENVDFIIAYMHWGNQYYKNPSKEQKELAGFLSEKGVDLILGTHPHVVQEIEEISIGSGRTHVIYSMGNFLSNQRYDTMGVSSTEDGVIFEIIIEKNVMEQQTGVKSIKTIPTWIDRRWNGNSYDYRILPVERALEGKLDIEIDVETMDRLKKSLSNTIYNLYN
ncbi:CapA family protein [Gudongella sp. DL1XJH-153]|uniref:CapA family protein n=1 Tax=Gudongella sp. DL1XJH-153 TaxID=3409804 RepID=UPI003BB4ADCF